MNQATVSNNTRRVTWLPYPSAESYRVLSAGKLGIPFAPDQSGTITGNEWVSPAAPAPSFHLIEAVPVSSNAVLTSIVLNRLAFGPTPDELDRVLFATNAIGPRAYIEEQLAPESLSDTELESTTAFKTPNDKLKNTQADDDELRAVTSMRAVGSKRQLLEVLLSFIDFHFNTQQDKSKEWFAGQVGNATDDYKWQATNLEYVELERWRTLLLQPNSTFEDLLRVSAESGAMIIYLDTILNQKSVPNENYSREIMELFTMGVDNGYDQKDIEEMSKCWTGWRIAHKLLIQTNDPFADPVGPNVPGAWALHFDQAAHSTVAKTIFKQKMVDPRFGAPYTTQNYGTNTTPGMYQLYIPARTGTNGMQDGYDIVQHLANLPYTQEFMTVKLCRWFVHEGFDFGYDYTAANLSPEAQLVKDCMTAWRTPGPDGRQGNIRSILRTIFNSSLFQSQGAAQHKIKNPFEFAASTLRALRAVKGDGTFTATTDGYGFRYPLLRMGGMKLYDRPEPDGWPETGIGWLNTANLGERMRYVQHVLIKSGLPEKPDYQGYNNSNISDPVGLVKLKLDPSSYNDAAAVVDYFLKILFVGEGKANLQWDRQAAIDFLNTDAAEKASPFAQLNNTSAVYEERVRGVVAFLLCLPRFQEQ